MDRRSLRESVFVLCIILALSTLTRAGITYDFHIFNSPAYENDPRLSFTMAVSDEGLDNDGRHKASFTFNNNSTATSSITDIYFDCRPGDSALNFKDISIIEGSGVNFSKNATPKSLPAGTEFYPAFDKSPEYSADSDSPVSDNGIDPNEWLKLIFTLDYNKTIDDIISELANGYSSSLQGLRIGIHIQSLPGSCDDSASAINNIHMEPIPEPATICLFGLGALSLIRRKK
ncbi:MAG: PEP-CTERM sorting domain-containing protein [Phycisphaerae bacterium]|nr:PEP-CTERM sorting domain-containing protein [Phycisphaerae bacterium]